MATVKRDDVKQKWEETEFPLVCETCLGDNPFVRMTKEAHGKKCQICETPFTVFAWQAGTKGRLKRVEICKTCAQAKNVCQVCIYDLQYGLPVQVRDQILKETGSTGSGMASAVPQSQANRSWYTAQQERALAQGQITNTVNEMAHAQLSEIAQMEPKYERNLPKLCTFYARGECNRGTNCPFRHELPRNRNDPLSKQNTRDRFYGGDDAVAKKMLQQQRKRQEEEAKWMAAEGYDRARATLYLRFQGESAATLTETAIRDAFYSYGEITSIRVQAEKGQAFVEYTQPEATQLAITSMNRKKLLGHDIFVAWAHAPKRGQERDSKQPSHTNRTDNPRSISTSQDSSQEAPVHKGTTIRPLAPPGGKSKAPIPKNLNPAPRPGGGPIRGAGAAAAARRKESNQPYYPSTNPSRLGSRTAGAQSSK